MVSSKYSEILDSVSRKHSLDISEVQKIADKVFSIINEALEKDKIVKIKGLGTFKIIEVHDRESINVNTGERMVIGGHSKISFTPDSTMRDRVNRPFAQFDTVQIENSVNMNMIDQVSEEETQRILESITLDPFAGLTDEQSAVKRNDYAEVDIPAPSIYDGEEETDVSEPQTLYEPRPVLDFVDDEIDDTDEDNSVEEIDKEDTTKNEESSEEGSSIIDTETTVEEDTSMENDLTIEGGENTKEEVEPKIEENSNAAEGTIIDEIPVLHGEQFDSTDEEEVEQDEEEDDVETSNSHCKLYWILATIILVLIALLVGFKAGEYYAENMKPQTQKSKMDAKVKDADKIQVDSVSKDTIKQKMMATESEIKAKERVNTKTKDEVQEITTPKVVEKPQANMPDYDSMDARVRTGAYAIVGLDRTVTVKANETLKRVSDRTLGPGMECYIEVYNGIKEVKEGQNIKIPKLVLKKKLVKKS